jgi:hypothetical protein
MMVGAATTAGLVFSFSFLTMFSGVTEKHKAFPDIEIWFCSIGLGALAGLLWTAYEHFLNRP